MSAFGRDRGLDGRFPPHGAERLFGNPSGCSAFFVGGSKQSTITGTTIIVETDTAVSLGAAGTVSGLLIVVVKWMLDNESRKIDEVLARLERIEKHLQTGVEHDSGDVNNDRIGNWIGD